MRTMTLMSLVVLAVAMVAWILLVTLTDAKCHKEALELGKMFLGFATTLGGFLGIAAGTGMFLMTGTVNGDDKKTVSRMTAGQTGAAGLAAFLAGGSVMGAEGWAGAIALTALLLGLGAVGFGTKFR